MGFLDLILFAAIAFFLGYRLWTVLGTHDTDRSLRKRRTEQDDVISASRSQGSPKPENITPQAAASSVEKKEAQFLKGAKLAFQKIVEAYATENLALLRKLVHGPLLETFEDAIEKRKKAKKTLEVDIGRITAAQILDQWEEQGNAYITVRFISQQSLLTRSSKGTLLEGDPDRYSEVTDIWTFSRPRKSSNPNWALVATQVPEADVSTPSGGT